MPTYYFFDFEAQLGVIFACGPAIRQFCAYYHRTRSFLPTRHRQYPNEDFEKMRWRINLRDLFWFRQAPMTGNRVFDAAPIFQRRLASPPDPENSGDSKSLEKVTNSILDVWERRIKQLFIINRSQQVRVLPAESFASSIHISFELAFTQSTTRRAGEVPYPSSLEKLAEGNTANSAYPNSSNPITFLQSETTGFSNSSSTTRNEPFSPLTDHEFAEELANPRTKPVHVSNRL